MSKFGTEMMTAESGEAVPQWKAATGKTGNAASDKRQVARRQRGRQADALLIARSVLGIAHDLNNYLAGTRLYGDLLCERLGASHRLAGEAQQVCFAVGQASELLALLLGLGRPAQAAAECCEVAPTIGGMLSLLGRLAGEPIELQSEIEPGVGRAAVDALSLRRVLLNLVLNARDAMPEGGRIRIRASRLNPLEDVFWNSHVAESSTALPRVLLEVRDTGHGMGAAMRAEAVELFLSTHREAGGFGIGLTAVREVVSNCGGRIEFESDAGRGTCVRVFLPCPQDEQATHAGMLRPQPFLGNERNAQ